jgi:hypothetical protein
MCILYIILTTDNDSYQAELRKVSGQDKITSIISGLESL